MRRVLRGKEYEGDGPSIIARGWAIGKGPARPRPVAWAQSQNYKHGRVTDVRGSWIAPAVKGGSTNIAYATGTRVGMDGYDASSAPTIKQFGTTEQYNKGTVSYSGFWRIDPLKTEPWPAQDVVHACGLMAASVTSVGFGTFVLDLSDQTAVRNFNQVATNVDAVRDSAEWIQEDSGMPGGGYYPLRTTPQ